MQQISIIGERAAGMVRSWDNTKGKNTTTIFSSSWKFILNKLASILTAEVGKPLQQSRNEINGAGSRIKWLTENAEKYLDDEANDKGTGAGRKNFL